MWRIVLIEGGISKNNTFYTKEALKQSVRLFEGVKIFAHKFGDTLDHRPDELADPYGLVSNQIGFVKNVRFEEGGEGRLTGDFHCTNSTIRDILSNTWKADREQMPGFSIDVLLSGNREGQIFRVGEIKKANSVDMVTSPAAGGQFERIVASLKQKKESKMNPLLKQLLALIKGGALSLKDSIEGKTDEQIVAACESEFGLTPEIYKAAEGKTFTDFVKSLSVVQPVKPEPVAADPAAKVDPAAPAPTVPAKESDQFLSKKLDAALKKVEESNSAAALEMVLAKESAMSEESKAKIRASMAGKIFDQAAAFAAVKAEKEYVERIRESILKDDKTIIQVVSTPQEKKVSALDLMVDPDLKKDDKEGRYKESTGFKSLHEAVRVMTGHSIEEIVNATPSELAAIRRKESTTSDFAVALGDSMNKRLIREYNFMREREIWTKLVTEEDVQNLNTQKPFRIGGFHDLDTVAENGAFTETNTPSETDPTYTLAKKGNKFTITEEMLINDDLRAIRAFPSGMARAGVRTLSKFVFNLITGADGSDNVNIQTIYDSKALYHNDHGGNITPNALATATLDVGVAAMMNQLQDTGSEDSIGIRARYLLVPPTLRRTAWDVAVNPLIQANANGGSIQNALKEYGIEPLVVPEGYLAFKQRCWYLIGDPMDCEGIRIGYLAGKRTPEILIQDQPTVAGVFTNDQITYRVKFRFGGAVMDFRPFYGGIVA